MCETVAMTNGVSILLGGNIDELGWSRYQISFKWIIELTVLFLAPVGPITLGDNDIH